MAAIISLNGFQLILASSSPRRRELLSHLGLSFQTMVPATEELMRPGESIRAYVLRNSCEKATAVLKQAGTYPEGVLVIGSDTVGVFQDQLLEKPRDAEDAKHMLRLLSGQTHEVLTGIAVVKWTGKEIKVWEKLVSTKVRFKSLLPHEIDYYVGTGEPLDKAGSYGIQGIGGFMVEAIEGSYSNVVGLPLVELTDLLRQALHV